MLDLNSDQWSSLEHAYGSAADIPALLTQLATLPACVEEEEPWSSIWSALAHQGDVYSASFAAVPQVVAALARDPVNTDSSFLHFPAWVETSRAKSSVDIPADLRPAYDHALAQLPTLIAARAVRDWDSDDVQIAMAAIAATKGWFSAAEAALELTPDVASDFLQWFFEQ